MEKDDIVVAVFADHQPAEVAVKKLAEIGFDKKHLSVLGKGLHSDAKIGGFYSTGQEIKGWGMRIE